MSLAIRRKHIQDKTIRSKVIDASSDPKDCSYKFTNERFLQITNKKSPPKNEKLETSIVDSQQHKQIGQSILFARRERKIIEKIYHKF